MQMTMFDMGDAKVLGNGVYGLWKDLDYNNTLMSELVNRLYLQDLEEIIIDKKYNELLKPLSEEDENKLNHELNYIMENIKDRKKFPTIEFNLFDNGIHDIFYINYECSSSGMVSAFIIHLVNNSSIIYSLLFNIDSSKNIKKRGSVICEAIPIIMITDNKDGCPFLDKKVFNSAEIINIFNNILFERNDGAPVVKQSFHSSSELKIINRLLQTYPIAKSQNFVNIVESIGFKESDINTIWGMCKFSDKLPIIKMTSKMKKLLSDYYTDTSHSIYNANMIYLNLISFASEENPLSTIRNESNGDIIRLYYKNNSDRLYISVIRKLDIGNVVLLSRIDTSMNTISPPSVFFAPKPFVDLPSSVSKVMYKIAGNGNIISAVSSLHEMMKSYFSIFGLLVNRALYTTNRRGVIKNNNDTVIRMDPKSNIIHLFKEKNNSGERTYVRKKKLNDYIIESWHRRGYYKNNKGGEQIWIPPTICYRRKPLKKDRSDIIIDT